MRASATIPITVSIGVAAVGTVPADGAGVTLESLLSRADRCLYASKENGRNRVTLENTAAEPPAGKRQ